MAYTPPAGNNANFNFTDTGYSPAAPHNFNFGVGAGTSDLLASIVATAVGGQANLPGYIKSTIEAAKNLGAYIKPTIQSTSDLVAAIRRIDAGTGDLGSSLHGWQPSDIGGEIGAHPPADLPGEVNIIELRNLPATVGGILLAGIANLNVRIGARQSAYADLAASMESNLLLAELPASINPIEMLNLPAFVRAFVESNKNLGAIVDIISVYNLPATLHGWDERFLAATLTGVYGPYDIQAYINPVVSKNLGAYIAGFKGIQIPIDLPATLSSWAILDLGASITVAGQRADLGAIIGLIEAVNLGATIIPKTILLKRALQISLLEHKDLKALVNFQCFSSGFSNLGASLHVLYKSDLKAFIVGWFGNSADNVLDMGAYINAENYYVQDVFAPKFVPEVDKYTQLKLRFTSSGPSHSVFDTQRVLFGSYYAGNLTASINGVLESYDLGASITAVMQTNYSELPDHIRPKTHEVVIDFNDRWQENWRRFVELMFQTDGSGPFHYFYVSGSAEVYRVDRSRHWTIWADSYIEDDEDIIERKDVRRKYIFNMSNYNNVDEAVRDIIDRVSDYRRANLGASISSTLPPSADLSATISPHAIYTWVSYLGASVNIISINNLEASITGV